VPPEPGRVQVALHAKRFARPGCRLVRRGLAAGGDRGSGNQDGRRAGDPGTCRTSAADSVPMHGASRLRP
jgi:hypothetical protein